jgi:hypothetical protein
MSTNKKKPAKKSAAQKKADKDFIKKISTLGMITKKSELSAFAEKHGVPTEFTCEHGTKFKMVAAQEVEVRVAVERKKHNDAGEESFSA